MLVLSGIGGLTALLVWPLSKSEESVPLARKFWRLFFPLLVPLAFLLFMALVRRVSGYGFIEVRYVGLVLSVWIICISGYYAFRPGANFKIIPWSLITVILVFSVGPWSSSSVAKRSQWNHLESLLIQYGGLKDGTLTMSPQDLSQADYQNFRSIVMYLVGGYGADIFEPIIAGIEKGKKVTKQGESWSDLSRHQFSTALIEFIGITSSEQPSQNRLKVTFEKTGFVALDSNTAIYEARNFLVVRGEKNLSLDVHGELIEVTKSDSDPQIEFRDQEGQLLAVLDFNDWINNHDPDKMSAEKGRYQFKSQEDLAFEVDLKSVGTVHVFAMSLDLIKRRNNWEVRDGDFWFLVRRD